MGDEADGIVADIFDSYWEEDEDGVEDWTPPSPRKTYAIGSKCPECGNMIVLVTNTNTGHRFAGCSNYPRCKVSGRTG